jgi:hypothetical protein
MRDESEKNPVRHSVERQGKDEGREMRDESEKSRFDSLRFILHPFAIAVYTVKNSRTARTS